MQSQENATWNNNNGQSLSFFSPKRPVGQTQEQTNPPNQPESAPSRPSKRERSHARPREPFMRREPKQRERSCSANRLEGVNSSLNNFHCSLCDKEFAR